jgi:hypothetical protein
VIDLSPDGLVSGSSISWTADTPPGTSVTVETNLSFDGGQTWQGWQVCTNGGQIPGIGSGTNLSNARLQTRITLSTTDTTVTPRMHSLTIEINQGSAIAATYLSQSTPLTFTAAFSKVRCVPNNITKWQLEQKPYATFFVDGTRAAGKLMYPGAIPSNEGTLLIWAKKNTLEPNIRDEYRKILDAQSPRVDFQWDQLGNLSANFGGANLSIPDPAQDLDWHQYTITYSGRTVKMYFDGQLVASGQAQEDLVNFSELCVGTRWDDVGAGYALFDELLILPYAATEEEIKGWYEAKKPFIDLNEINTIDQKLKAHMDAVAPHSGAVIDGGTF